MPSHQDRVRRNYHEIFIFDQDNIKDFSHDIHIIVNRSEIASAMTRRDLKYMIIRKIELGIENGYKE